MKSSALIAMFGLASLGSATVLSPGSLAIIGYNSDDPDTVAIVALTDMSVGTSFYMADGGWMASQGLYTTEGYVLSTLNQSVAAGTVFTIKWDSTALNYTSSLGSSAFSYDFNKSSSTPKFALSTAGDSIFLWQGGLDTSTWKITGNPIYAVNGDNTDLPADGWQPTATNSNTSGLPTGLVDGKTAIGLCRSQYGTEFDDYAYIGTRTGSVSEILAAIGNRANWTGSDTALTFDTTSFKIATVPEPASMIALGFGAIALISRRRRNR